MRTHVFTIPWLGEDMLTPYAWAPLTLGGFRFATLIQAPVSWILLRRTPQVSGALPGRDIRPYVERLRLGYTTPLDPEEKYEVKPCAFPPRLNTAVAAKNDADMLLNSPGDLAAADVSQANELGGATTPALSFRERRCIVVLSDEPLDEPGDLFLDVELTAGAAATTNFMLAQTVHGMPAVCCNVWNLSAFVQSAFAMGLERNFRAGDLTEVALSFAAIPAPGYMKSWVVSDQKGLASQNALASFATLPAIMLWAINSTLGDAKNRVIVRGRARI